MDGGDIRGAVHSNIRHDSAVKHVTGKAVYIDDMPVPPDSQEVALVLLGGRSRQGPTRVHCVTLHSVAIELCLFGVYHVSLQFQLYSHQ